MSAGLDRLASIGPAEICSWATLVSFFFGAALRARLRARPACKLSVFSSSRRAPRAPDTQGIEVTPVDHIGSKIHEQQPTHTSARGVYAPVYHAILTFHKLKHPGPTSTPCGRINMRFQLQGTVQFVEQQLYTCMCDLKSTVHFCNYKLF